MDHKSAIRVSRTTDTIVWINHSAAAEAALEAACIVSTLGNSGVIEFEGDDWRVHMYPAVPAAPFTESNCGDGYDETQIAVANALWAERYAEFDPDSDEGQTAAEAILSEVGDLA